VSPRITTPTRPRRLRHLEHRADVARRVGEPGSRWTLTTAVNALVVLLERFVALEGHALFGQPSTASSMSSTGKLRIVDAAGVWLGLATKEVDGRPDWLDVSASPCQEVSRGCRARCRGSSPRPQIPGGHLALTTPSWNDLVERIDSLAGFGGARKRLSVRCSSDQYLAVRLGCTRCAPPTPAVADCQRSRSRWSPAGGILVLVVRGLGGGVGVEVRCWARVA
jgi:hypothetical protein